MHRSIRAAAAAAAAILVTPANAATLYTFNVDGIGTTLQASPANSGIFFPVSQFYNATFSFVLGRDGPFVVPGNDGATFVQGNIDFDVTSDRLSIGITNGFLPRNNFGSTSVSVCGDFGSAFPTAIGSVAITPGCGSAKFQILSSNNGTDFSGQVRSLVISEVSDFRSPFIFAQAVPEPSTWALMLAGFGMVGYAMRRRPQVVYA